MALSLASPAFEHGDPIPRRYTCEGDDISPPLEWSGVPAGTKSLVLIVDDPDAPDPVAPKRVWVHWVLYDIPPDVAGLLEGVGGTDLPPGTLEGLNDAAQGSRYRLPGWPAGVVHGKRAGKRA